MHTYQDIFQSQHGIINVKLLLHQCFNDTILFYSYISVLKDYLTPSDILKKKIFLIKRQFTIFNQISQSRKTMETFLNSLYNLPFIQSNSCFSLFYNLSFIQSKIMFFSINLQSLLYSVKNHVFHYFTISPLFSHKSCLLLCNLSFIQRLK